MLTEDRNPRTRNIDRLSTLEMIQLINREDGRVTGAVRAVLPQIASAIDQIVPRLRRGGRLFYVGAGTSGRLGVLDAVECVPTFGIQAESVQGVLAGGYESCHRAKESAEDDPHQGQEDLRTRGLDPEDAVVGISASGKTPYTLGAIRYARALGALTVGISCNLGADLSRLCQVAIEVLVGPEVVAGSTRMKAGTAQKMVLNMISTAAMIHLGNVYSNLMVNLNLSSRKLIRRGARIVAEAAGVPQNRAETALKETGDVRSAIIMLELACTSDEARGLVSQSVRLNELLKDKHSTP
ncbi:MAG: N-acetylmuramic acid 6-phosphate etherase [Acidobacteriota bacterium]